MKVIISVLGEDRPGIIAAVSAILADQDCNIENVSQTILQNEFSGIFIASIPENLSAELLQKFLRDGVEKMGLHVHVREMKHRKIFAASQSEPFVITTRGPDRKGLVSGITAVMARHNVNVTNLQAVFKGGDNPNDNMMIYEVDIPMNIGQQQLESELRQTASDLGLHISIQHRNIFHALNRI